MHHRTIITSLALACASLASSARAQNAPIPYVLDSSSQFIVQPCLGPCDCVSPPLIGTLRGTFDLRLISIGNVFDFYEVLNVNWIGRYNDSDVPITGSGLYFESTHLAEAHRIELDLAIGQNATARFENGLEDPIGRLFTFIDIDAITDVIDCDQYTVEIRATPVCRPDFDRDGFITGLDFDAFVTAFEQGWWFADFDGDGFISGNDFDEFVRLYEAGC